MGHRIHMHIFAVLKKMPIAVVATGIHKSAKFFYFLFFFSSFPNVFVIIEILRKKSFDCQANIRNLVIKRFRPCMFEFFPFEIKFNGMTSICEKTLMPMRVLSEFSEKIFGMISFLPFPFSVFNSSSFSYLVFV